ncbi:hypothetical protein ACE939_01440 [Aquimarina sp. W85]|uniref:hypothetical protein n=1 Tax=Aquimarina rhodophyticola TaxID=3342246 RepID=UPI00366B2C67
MNNVSLAYKIDTHRRLCINKDTIELNQWMDVLEQINVELDFVLQIEKQFFNSHTLDSNIKGLRRTNTLTMATLCQYEQQLKKEYEYGTRAYDTVRAKEHEKIREVYQQSLRDFWRLKVFLYQHLSNLQVV